MNGQVKTYVNGVGLLAPGINNWKEAAAVFNTESLYVHAATVLPVPECLPPAERRRASRVIRLSLAIGFEAIAHSGADASKLATVFTSSGADGHNCHSLCEQLATDDRQISPTRFHNSVHNAAAGYWGIATGSMAPCQVIGAHDASFCAGLLDAMAQVMNDGEPVLLVAYDSEYPEPLFAKRNTPDCAGVAIMLSPYCTPKSLASISVRPTTQAAEQMPDENLDQLREKIPALRSLPLLSRIAQRQAGTVILEYLQQMSLSVEVSPC
jgi:hypothetical protein